MRFEDELLLEVNIRRFITWTPNQKQTAIRYLNEAIGYVRGEYVAILDGNEQCWRLNRYWRESDE